MADAQQIVENMEKYSQVKKLGVFVRAGEALKGAVQGIFTERDKTREVSDIAIKDAVDHFPAEVKTSIENIKKSPIWKKETLEKLPPDVAKHIEQLAAQINTLIEREGKISGAKNITNQKYQDWMKAFSNYEKVVDEFSSFVTISTQVPEASVDKQKEELGITEGHTDKTELLSAFAYMGIEITPKEDGTYTFKEIDGGLPYKDKNGQTQYLRISKEAALAFVNNYFEDGATTQKEEKALAQETEILENMRENAKKGGIDAPTPEEIKKQEKKVEDAKKALDAAKERTITPKGLFRYFIEQEIKGSTKKRNLDPELITRAEALFDPNSPQWGAFSLNRDLESFNDDLALVGSLSLATGEMQEFMETHEEVPQFDDFLTSSAADRFKTRRVVNRLENDAIGMHKDIGHAIDMTDLAIENIIEKYRTKVAGLEESVRLYEKNKQPVPENISKLIEETNKKIEALELYGSVIKNIKDSIPNLSNVPEELKTNDTLLVKTISEKIQYDETLGKIVLTEDLTNDKGEVWLSKDQFLEMYNARVLESKGMDPNVLPNVMESSLGIELEPGLNFEQVIANDAMQERAIHFAMNPPNFIADMYAKFKEKKKQYPELTGQDFAKEIFETQQGKDGALKDEMVVQGIASMDAIGRAFDACAEMEASGKTSDIDLSAHASTKDGYAKAQIAYYHMDVVAQMIAEDPELREEYETASLEDKKKIFGRVYTELKNNKRLENPTEEQIKAAVDRWRPYGLLSHNAKIFKDFQNSPEFEENETNLNTLMALGKMVSEEEAMLNSIIENAKPGQKTVDYGMEYQNMAESDNMSDKYRDPKFIEMFPRGIPQFKIEKSLQPYNIKAGLKLLDQIMDAFNEVMVKDPWSRMVNKETGRLEKPILTSGSDGAELSEDEENANLSTNPPAHENDGPDNSGGNNGGGSTGGGNNGGSNTGTTQNTAGEFSLEGLDDNAIRNAAAMSAIGSGVKNIIEQLEVGKDPTAAGIVGAMDYVNNMAVNGPIVNFGSVRIPLPDAMRNVLMEFAAGGAKNPDGSPMAPEQQQAANLNNAKQQIENLKAQLSQVQPGTPEAAEAAKCIAHLDSFAYAFTSGLLTPAEVTKLIGMTSMSTMQAANENGAIEISPGADLSPEQVATLRTCKTQEEFDKKAIEFGLYKQNVVNEVYGVKEDAQAAMESGEGMGNT